MHTPLYDIPFLESYLCNERGALRLRQAFLEVFRAFFRLGRVVPAFGIVITSTLRSKVIVLFIIETRFLSLRNFISAF
jgi:hypothetical protein